MNYMEQLKTELKCAKVDDLPEYAIGFCKQVKEELEDDYLLRQYEGTTENFKLEVGASQARKDGGLCPQEADILSVSSKDGQWSADIEADGTVYL